MKLRRSLLLLLLHAGRPPMLRLPWLRLPRLPILRLPWLRLPMLRLPMLQLPMLRLPMLRLPMPRLPWLRLPMLQLQMLRLPWLPLRLLRWLPSPVRHLPGRCGLLAMAGCAAMPVQAAVPDGGAVLATVFAAGDIADCRYSRPPYSGAARTAALIAAGPADATILTLGDHVYPVATAAALNGCYQATWGAFRARTRPVPGNHDYAGGRADAYYQYFGAQAGPPRRGYYSFELGAWRLYALNSHLKGADHAAQLQWLKDELARHPARCTLAYWHVPLYSSGGHAANTHMRETWRVLHAAGAELVLSGHDHDYERFEPMDADGRIDLPRGMRQFVVGTGGAYLTPFLWPEPGSAARLNASHGVLKLELLEDGYRWQFLPADPGGPAPEFPAVPQQDSGNARCH